MRTFSSRTDIGLARIGKVLSRIFVPAATDVPTTLDEVLFWLEDGLNAVLDIVGPFIGLDFDETKAVEYDIHTLINDIRDLGDGHIDVDHGLEKILTDLLVILGDFGVPTSQRKGELTSTYRQGLRKGVCSCTPWKFCGCAKHLLCTPCLN